MTHSKLNAADHLQAIYLEWLNDWLTYDAFAEHYGMSPRQAAAIIAAGSRVHARRTTRPKHQCDSCDQPHTVTIEDTGCYCDACYGQLMDNSAAWSDNWV